MTDSDTDTRARNAGEDRLRADAGDPDAGAQVDGDDVDRDLVDGFAARLVELDEAAELLGDDRTMPARARRAAKTGGLVAFTYEGATYLVPRFERWPGRAMRALDEGALWDGIAWAIDSVMGRVDAAARAAGVRSAGDDLLDTDADVLELEALLVAVAECQGADPKALRPSGES